MTDSLKQSAMCLEVKSLLQKKVLVPVPQSEEKQGFYSPLFLVKKPSGAFRVKINLKALNKFLSYKKFCIESIKLTISLLFPNCVMESIDLEDAYYHIPIHSSHPQSSSILRRELGPPSIFSSTFRGISSTPSVYKGDGGDSCLYQNKGHSHSPISRRLSYCGEFRRSAYLTDTVCKFNPQIPMLEPEPKKILSCSLQDLSVFGNIPEVIFSNVKPASSETAIASREGTKSIPRSFQRSHVGPRSHDSSNPSSKVDPVQDKRTSARHPFPLEWGKIWTIVS
ncbi:uncharacterized protein LOC130297303 [Hyla sarda]|uniref:uncharacterized protein LOC130297303 n=1 Tax=Hyla sarda TaxID=327740 RepID=UPI0024C2A66D|nr:uncharacterized protein LOC130297303 [Hyla sarda]